MYGVCYRTFADGPFPGDRTGKYEATIGAGTKSTKIGEFDDAIEAAMARDRRAREKQGEYAYLNVPDACAPESATGGFTLHERRFYPLTLPAVPPHGRRQNHAEFPCRRRRGLLQYRY